MTRSGVTCKASPIDAASNHSATRLALAIAVSGSAAAWLMGRLLAGRRRGADQLGVFRIDRRTGARRRLRRDLPETDDHGEDQRRQHRRAQSERGLHRSAQVRLIAKLFTYSAGLAGSNALPITTIDFFDGSGGVRPISFIIAVVSVTANTSDATLA